MNTATRELVVRATAALLRSALWWTSGIIALVLVTVAFWPSLEGSDALKSLGDMSDSLLKAFGAQNIATPAGYLDGQLFALMVPLLLSGLAIANVTALTSGDESAGRLELLHALPVSRRSIWLSRFVAMSATQVGVATILAVAMAAALSPFSLSEAGTGRVVAATFASALLALFHGSVGYAASGFGAPRGQAVGIAVLILVAGYIINFLFPLAGGLTGIRKVSPWYWAIGDQPVTNGVSAPWLLLLVAVSAVLVGVGTSAVERRDIRSA